MEPRNPIPVTPPEAPPTSPVPRELEKVTLPRYVIEPPDILLIEGVKLVPKSPHRIETFDVLLIRVIGAFPEQPIDNTYNVDADGTVNLGPTYGRIKVVGLTIEEAEDEIRNELAKVLTDVDVSVSLLASAGAQQITGQHLVAMDGRVNLGTYGSVFVAGMTDRGSPRGDRKAAHRRSSTTPKSSSTCSPTTARSTTSSRKAPASATTSSACRSPATKRCIDAVANPRRHLAGLVDARCGSPAPRPTASAASRSCRSSGTTSPKAPSPRPTTSSCPATDCSSLRTASPRSTPSSNKMLNPFERIFGFVSLGTSMANRIVRFGLANTF